MRPQVFRFANSPFTPEKIARKPAVTGLDLLISGRYIAMQSAGVYNLYPLGVRVLNNIREIIRIELSKCGIHEVDFASLQIPDPWQATGRFDDDVVDVWLKTTSRSGVEYGLAFTHEEAVANSLSTLLNSYRQFPLGVTQFQTKFRDELRPRAGLIRLREFEMNDTYTFATTQEMHDGIYKSIADAYDRIFEILGLGNVTKRVLASGGAFSKYSEEFQVVSPLGEDTIYIHKRTGVAVNAEIIDDYMQTNGGSIEDFEKVRSIEVGNIFSLGTKFSEPLNCTFANQDGEQHPLIMGSYGIGVHRVMGVLAEIYATERGIDWPEKVAPIDVHITVLFPNNEALELAETISEKLNTSGKAVSLENSLNGPGPKLGIADQVGAPIHLIINGNKVNTAIESGEAFEIEVALRATGEKSMLTLDQLFSTFDLDTIAL